MTDRELLELAAKAAGIAIDKSQVDKTGFDVCGNVVLDWHNAVTWNPLTDDGDALRLAVDLDLGVSARTVVVWRNSKEVLNIFEDEADPYAATRRAIVMAAAEIGRSMK